MLLSYYYVEITEMCGDMQFEGTMMMELPVDNDWRNRILHEFMVYSWRSGEARHQDGWYYGDGVTYRLAEVKQLTEEEFKVMRNYITYMGTYDAVSN